jgi:hypothetical protein
MAMDETHLSVILDLLKNGEMTSEKATAAIARMAEHQHIIDHGEEARFKNLYREDMAPFTIDNYHRPWLVEDVQLLINMRKAGTDFAKIARKLKRTERGIRSRWAFEMLLEREANRATALPVAAGVIAECFEELQDERPAVLWSWYEPPRENNPNRVLD